MTFSTCTRMCGCVVRSRSSCKDVLCPSHSSDVDAFALRSTNDEARVVRMTKHGTCMSSCRPGHQERNGQHLPS
eukprot:2839730-Pleurochrysis_carterae.AAC.1